MALKDRLTDALNAADSDRRRQTLRQVLEAGGDGDAEVRAALAKVIAEREQKAASYGAAGQSDLAKAEHEEIDALRGFLRMAGDTPQPKKSKPAPAAASPGAEAGPLVSNNQKIIVAVAAAVLVIGALLYYFAVPSNSGNDMVVNSPTAGVTVFKDDRTLGNPKAKVTMLEYAAPSCPHCAHFDMTEFPQLREQYIDTGKVYYIFRVFPLMPADGAAEAIARCLPADKYFWFIDLMFRNQKSWDPEYGITDVRGALIQLAKVAGLDTAKVDQCISDKNEQDRINAVAQDAINKYNIEGTPTFIINGEVVQAEDAAWPQLKAKLDSLLSKH